MTQHQKNTDDMNITSNPSYTYDPFDRNIVGPRSCEYCHAPTTLQCKDDCSRPKLYFERKKPPFDNENSNFLDMNNHQVSIYRRSNGSLLDGGFGNHDWNQS